MSEWKFNDIPVFVAKSNRKSVSVEIKSDGIYVRAPLQMREAQIKALLEEKRSWIEKHWETVAKRSEEAKEFPPYTYEELQVLAEKALQVLPGKVQHYAKQIGVDYGHITIRNQRTRWGSCSSKGNLNFNCLLMLMPDEVIDSVVVHELCHRKHMNHSAQFYAEVEKAFPAYRRCDKWLKENGRKYLNRLG